MARITRYAVIFTYDNAAASVTPVQDRCGWRHTTTAIACVETASRARKTMSAVGSRGDLIDAADGIR